MTSKIFLLYIVFVKITKKTKAYGYKIKIFGVVVSFLVYYGSSFVIEFFYSDDFYWK